MKILINELINMLQNKLIVNKNYSNMEFENNSTVVYNFRWGKGGNINEFILHKKLF